MPVILASFFLLAAPSHNQRRAGNTACLDREIMRLCADSPVGTEAHATCSVQRFAEARAACPPMSVACAADMDRYCDERREPVAELRDCLRSMTEWLDPECAAFVRYGVFTDRVPAGAPSAKPKPTARPAAVPAPPSAAPAAVAPPDVFRTPPPAGALMGGGCVTQKLSALCGGAQLGTPEYAACSQQRLGEASAACSTAQPDAASSIRQPFDPKDPCRDDLVRLCDGKPNESSYGPDCLRAHRRELNPACAASPLLKKEIGDPNAPQPAAPKPHFRQTLVIGKCSKEDIANFCGDAESKDIDACLKDHESEVSDSCRARISYERSLHKEKH